MYKKNDFSSKAMRAATFTTCKKNGELGMIVWFGTKSKGSASKKANRLLLAMGDLNLKKFPSIEKPTTSGERAE